MYPAPRPRLPLPEPAKRLLYRVCLSSAFVRVAPPLMARLDKALNAASRGRFTLTGMLLPTTVLTTTGCRSGRPRSTPALCLPEPGGFLVFGGNYGKPNHPQWTGNLLTLPQAQVEHAGRRLWVQASLLTGQDRAEVWPSLVRAWPPLTAIQRAAGREVRVFRLAVVEAAPADKN
ncbi:nitroreductase family deazaflavin-dependent oxidoreductase [Streptomyces lavendulae]|uniref:nitroreductase family deazaflavin-dependent oxidoreductase n=1 Tax=Streptomyces lavendulae TaxID=1914 RepID=UPI0024A25DF3|nr:hypothetical protein Slala05_81530 [Streptomyces lavendulae subsp. lavendulae]